MKLTLTKNPTDRGNSTARQNGKPNRRNGPGAGAPPPILSGAGVPPAAADGSSAPPQPGRDGLKRSRDGCATTIRWVRACGLGTGHLFGVGYHGPRQELAFCVESATGRGVATQPLTLPESARTLGLIELLTDWAGYAESDHDAERRWFAEIAHALAG